MSKRKAAYQFMLPVMSYPGRLSSPVEVPERNVDKWQRSGRRPRRGLLERIAQLPNELIQMVQELVVSTQLNAAFNVSGSRKQLTYRGTWETVPILAGQSMTILHPQFYDARFNRSYHTRIFTLPGNDARVNVPISQEGADWLGRWVVGARSLLPGRSAASRAMAILQAGLGGRFEFGPSRYPPLSDPRRRVPPPGPSGPFADARRRVPPPPRQ